MGKVLNFTLEAFVSAVRPKPKVIQDSWSISTLIVAMDVDAS